MSLPEYHILSSDTARLDLETIIEYLARDYKDRAHDIFTQIKEATEELEYFPHRGRIVPELEYHFIMIYREIIVKRWRIIYRIEEQKIFILGVIDTHRNIEDVLLQRLLKS